MADFAGLDEDEFRAQLRAWLAEHLPARWRHRSFGASDVDLIDIRRAFGRLLGSAGWLSATWPADRGGNGLSSTFRVVVLEELVAVGAPEPMNSNALGIFAPTLIKFGTTEQCEGLLPPMLRHDTLWCQGFSEPEAGSDLAAISTAAQPVTGGFILYGQKVWTSHASLAEMCYMLVRTDRGESRHRGLTLMAVPFNQPQVTVRSLRNIVGTDEFCEVFLDGAFVPDQNVIGQPGQGWPMAMYALSQERSVGLAQRSMKLTGEFDALLRLCGEEIGNHNTVLTDEFFSGPLVDTFVAARAVDATVRRTLETDGRDGDLRALAPVAKLSWSESHQRQLRLALDLLSNRAVLGAVPGQDWLRAALFSRAETIYGGTSEIQRNLLSRALGLPGGRR
jgi:alkylation response protein AidB-like acyl-CoA dehydrogenase